MNKNHSCFTTRAMVVAVHCALLAMAAMPMANAEEDAAVAELTQPTKTVEVGVRDTSSGSYKAGEYNGLEKKGATAIANIDARGGGSYDSENAKRWRITGTELGLETRNLTTEYGQQGSFRINFGYDELLRNRSDSYQTPLQGIGSNRLTLPSSWLVPAQLNVNPNKTVAVVPVVNVRALDPNFINNDPVYRFNNAANATAAGAPSAIYAASPTQIANMLSAAANDNALFQNVNIHTKRTKYDVGLEYIISEQFTFTTSMRHELKDGYKLMSTVSRNTGGDLAVVIPDLINQTTDQFNMALNFKGDHEFLQAAYYGSIFKNGNNSMTWQNWGTGNAMDPLVLGGQVATAVPTTFDTMSTGAPDNQFHQLSLTGGYDFSKATKLVVNTSYARNTQNQTYLTDSSTPVVPQTSLNGLVISKAFNLKLTNKASKDLNLTANYKFDERDNRTAVNTYQFADAGEAPVASTLFTGLGVSSGAPAVVAQNANANRPYSKRINQFNLDGDYRLTRDQAFKLGYDWQKTDRYCNGTWISCVDAATTKENTLRAEWRTTFQETITGKLGYAYAKRKVDNYNENAFLALVPYANVVPIGSTQSAYQYMIANGLTGYGPQAGYAATTGNANILFPLNNALANAAYANNNRISELIGMRRFNMADRNRNKVRSSVNWQASEKFSVQGGLDYNNDDYANSVYGLQSAKSWAMNLEGAYAASEDFSASVFFTYEDQRSKSAGNTYTANSNTAFIGQTGIYTTVSGSPCYTTLLARNNNNKLDACLNWSADMRDKVNTLGFTFKQKGLMTGKVELNGDLVFTRATTDNNVTGGSYANNPAAVANGSLVPGQIAAFYIPAAALPTVTTNTVQLKLNSKYTLDKQQSVRLGYSYLHMKAVDYAYDGMQTNGGGLTGVLPSNETAPAYTVHTVGASYLYNF